MCHIQMLDPTPLGNGALLLLNQGLNPALLHVRHPCSHSTPPAPTHVRSGPWLDSLLLPREGLLRLPVTQMCRMCPEEGISQATGFSA